MIKKLTDNSTVTETEQNRTIEKKVQSLPLSTTSFLIKYTV